MTSSRSLSAPRILGGSALLATLLLSGCAPATTSPAPTPTVTSSAAGSLSSAPTSASTTASAKPAAATSASSSSSSASSTAAASSSATPATSGSASTTTSASSTAPASSATASPSATATRGASAPTTTTAPDCAGITGAEALAADPKAVRPGEHPWDTADPDVTAFDDCAALSAVVVHIQGPTGSSPHQVSLYHEGTFIGHATANDFGFAPRIERVSDDTLRITYTYGLETEKGSESTAEASGQAPLTVTYDAATGTVKRSGMVPPGYPKDETVPEAPLDGTP